MTARNPGNALRWLFSSRHGPANRSIPRWIFLRALAAIYFSAFFSLLFQIKGLIGPNGILPAHNYLAAVDQRIPIHTLLVCAFALLDFDQFHTCSMAVTWIGLIASVIAFLNLWPRLSFFICFLCFLSFVIVIQRLLQLSIRRHAARSRLHRTLLRAARHPARLGS